YDFCSGTSMSAPHVSGLAGLLYSYYTGFTYSQIRSTILRYVDVLPELTGWILTNGRVNAYKALSSLLPPTGLTASYSSSISLSWTDNATGEDGYKIERNVSGGGYVQIAAIGPDSTAYTDPDVNSTTTYSYRVRAYNNIPADSSYSNQAVVPITPTNLSASAVSTSQINLSWTDNSNNEIGFSIEQKDDAGGTYTEIATVGADVTTYSTTGLNKAKTYFYRVLAYTGTGSSAYSNEASAKTLGSIGGGGSCSIGTRQNTPTAMANIAVLLIPLLFMAIIRLKRRYRGQKV
ncbi:MAG: fibronectin type III domain-containing protein, partial [Thermodesulfovibrionia bacterium]